ncbi:MAG: DNA polymerase IV [Clostridia bacterium]|nr:DNA polymerase IV [Clostridia bacterium]MBQ8859641.1 DNA polymerase IV [Clostridia bacterium]
MEEKTKQSAKHIEDRVILHCDCNSFFASVETVLHPEYRGVPMAVCGSEADRHGIVLAKNELAKAYGIVTAETVWSARQKCPNLVIAPPHHDAYLEFSRRINRIYDRYTDLVEPFSVDESWLDVTGSRALFGDGLAIAEEIRRAVKKEIGVTVSIGVSFNKMFAKMGSDYKKPDAITAISRDNFEQIIYPLPVESMMFIGPHTAAALHACNIHTLGNLAQTSRAFLSSRFGKMGDMIYRYVHGEDDSPVLSREERADPKSVGNGMTFRRDLESAEEIRVGLSALSEEIAARLRALGKKATTLSVSIKDTMLGTVSRQRPLSKPSALARELSESAFAIVLDAWRIGRPIRALTVTAMNLVGANEGGEQLSLFDEGRSERRERTERLEDAVDGIRRRFGKSSISSGAILSNDFGLAPRKNSSANDEKSKKSQKNR